MTITPEQFNKIAMKEDLDRVETKIDALAGDVHELVNSMAGLATEVKVLKQEQVANIGAHDRLETRIIKLEEVIL